MKILNGTTFDRLAKDNPKSFQGLFPDLIKKLLLSNNKGIVGIRVPGNDDVWAPGYDGVVESNLASRFVCAGKSVWEFGTSKRPYNKVEDDYKKRTATPLGIDQNQTEYYLIVPHVWAYKGKGQSITEWENKHKGEWKNVHVYDAVQIADWLNECPDVCAWFLEELGEGSDMDFSTVSAAWDRFSKKTNPALCKELFIEGRDKNKADFVARLGQPVTRVKASTGIDSLGFCLACLLDDSALANTVIVIHNANTYRSLARFCKGKTFLLGFRLDFDVIEGNNTILYYNREDTVLKADVELPQLSKTAFEKALQKMNLPKDEAGKLYRQTHGNMLALIRRIPGNSIESSPKWTRQDDFRFLAPIMLLQSFDTENECDRNMVAFLANDKYENVFMKYDAWSRLEDYPVKYVESHIMIVAFEEAWEILGLSPRSPIFERLIEAIETLAYSCEGSADDKHKIVDIRTLRHLRQLLLSLVYFAYDLENKYYIDKAIDSLVNHKPFAPKLLEHLSIMAEAAPSVIMDFLKRDIETGNGIVAEYFGSKGYSTACDKILWALDELVLHEETKVSACDILFELSRTYNKKAFSNSNTPRNSLLNALCLWSYYTLFSIEEKEKMVNRYLNEGPAFMVPFIVDLLLKDNAFYGIKEWKKQTPSTTISVRDLCEVRNRLGKTVLKECIENKDIECLRRLLLGYHHFYANTIEEAAELFDAADYSIDVLIPLNYDLRHSVFFAQSDEESQKWIPALEAWIKCTTPADEIGCVGWMFYDYYDYRYDRMLEENNGLDLAELSKKRNEKRIDAFNKATASIPNDRFAQFIHFSKDEYDWGLFYAGLVNANVMRLMALEAFSCKKLLLLAGLLDSAILDDCICFLNSLSDTEQARILGYMHRHDITDSIDSKEKKKAFWANKNMHEYDETTYRGLLQYYPYGLLPYYAYISKAPMHAIFEKIIEIFEAVAEFAEKEDSRYHRQRALNELDEIMNKLEKEKLYNEKLAGACLKLHDLDLLENYPETLRKYYFNDPLLLCKKASQNSKYYSEFGDKYRLPECAYENESAFMFFVDTLIKNDNESKIMLTILGGILGRSIVGSDGFFPHEYVRIAMEKYRHMDLSRHVFLGELNARESIFVGDGSEEKASAEKCHAIAKFFAVSFPETSKLWKMMEEEHSYESKHEHILSEIGVY
ncbi:MAG: hypothetical protein IKO51_10550 [Clostridia bacterium]|nr:hypothetical protein [Clostridia bacterium]